MSIPMEAFVRDPPPGEDRWAAGTNAMTQQVIGAATFSLATLVFGMRLFARLGIAKVKLRTDDCELTFSNTGPRWSDH